MITLSKLGISILRNRAFKISLPSCKMKNLVSVREQSKVGRTGREQQNSVFLLRDRGSSIPVYSFLVLAVFLVLSWEAPKPKWRTLGTLMDTQKSECCLSTMAILYNLLRDCLIYLVWRNVFWGWGIWNSKERNCARSLQNLSFCNFSQIWQIL